ncbi:MAG: hypothetical protein JWR49_1453, partial [Tardiphaga sp.]|nr:hypothetical protein [Tardiphaga sp.]
MPATPTALNPATEKSRYLSAP